MSAQSSHGWLPCTEGRAPSMLCTRDLFPCHPAQQEGPVTNPQFTDEKTDSQTGVATCPWPHMAGLGLGPMFPDCRVPALGQPLSPSTWLSPNS